MVHMYSLAKEENVCVHKYETHSFFDIIKNYHSLSINFLGQINVQNSLAISDFQKKSILPLYERLFKKRKVGQKQKQKKKGKKSCLAHFFFLCHLFCLFICFFKLHNTSFFCQIVSETNLSYLLFVGRQQCWKDI